MNQDQQYGPQAPFSNELHSQKYRQPGEDFREAMNRVSFGLADNGNHYQDFRPILLDMRFMPAGRIQSAIGSDRGTTPYNCYVSGTLGDSYVDGHDSIMQRALEAAATMRMGGGIGYDFSTLRPSGDLIVKLQSKSSGPLSFMEIFDAVCRCTSSSGHRRGAQMGVMRIDHPDIMSFVRAKNNRDKLTGFNMSIAVTDEFMEAKAAGRPFDLRFKGRTYKTVDPAEMWEAIMRSTWDWAEPGVLFIDTINRMNNLWYCETLAATNPCGEQPLPPHGACLLGSFNLTRYMRRGPSAGIGLEGWYFDWDQFKADIPHVVRAMDNVVDRARYPLSQQHDEAVSKRRMGLGVTGLANAGEAMGLPYGSRGFIEFDVQVQEMLRDESYRASALLARDKGAFPLYNEEKYLAGEFIKTLPEDVRALIKKHGIRNSHLLSIAPTGTISLCADNISSSIEPVFSYQMERTVIEFDGPRTETIHDYGVKHFGVKGKRSSEVTIAEHVNVLAAASRLVDSAVSKTCNTNGKLPWDEFKGAYDMAWQLGCKGITTFNQDGKRFGVIVAKDDDSSKTSSATAAKPVEVTAPSCEFDPATGRKSCE
jgi:ribonucleoside-diphosphate reductase alpha chain